MNRSQYALRVFAILAILGMARYAAATPPFRTAYGVDSALGGSMNFTSPPVYDFNMGMVTITAENFSATRTYQSVGLPLEFFYPAVGTTVNGNGFNYLGGGAWRNTAGTQQLDVLGVNPPFTSIIQPLLPALINVPLTDSIGPFTASVNSTDSVPLIELGDFAPGAIKSFTVLFSEPIGGGPPPFHFVSDAFFVAVPEPSAMVLCALAGVILLGIRRRIAV